MSAEENVLSLGKQAEQAAESIAGKSGRILSFLSKAANVGNIYSGVMTVRDAIKGKEGPWEGVIGALNAIGGITGLLGSFSRFSALSAGGGAVQVGLVAFPLGELSLGAVAIGSTGAVLGAFASGYGIGSSIAPYVWGDKPIFGYYPLPWGTGGGRTVSVTPDQWFREEDDPKFFQSYVLPGMEKQRINSMRNEMNEWISKAYTF